VHVQHQKSEAGKTPASRFQSSLPGSSLTGLRSVAFFVSCWRCFVPWLSPRRLPNTSRAPDLFTQQVCRVGLDLAIQRGCRRRASPCSREPMRSSRRFVRNWTFRGSEVAAK